MFVVSLGYRVDNFVRHGLTRIKIRIASRCEQSSRKLKIHRENSHNLPLCAGIRETILVVGNGMVSQRFCAKMRELVNVDQARIIVIGEETWPAYDRVQLTKYFELMSAEPLLLATRAWYKQHDIELRTGIKVESVDLAAREVVTSDGERCVFDRLVLATGSAPFVPPVPGIEREGVFVYRTLDDLDAIRAYADKAKRCAVLGGGLLGPRGGPGGAGVRRSRRTSSSWRRA
jgi:hypothetical protein